MTADTFEALLLPNLPSVRRFVQMRLQVSRPRRRHSSADPDCEHSSTATSCG